MGGVVVDAHGGGGDVAEEGAVGFGRAAERAGAGPAFDDVVGAGLFEDLGKRGEAFDHIAVVLAARQGGVFGQHGGEVVLEAGGGAGADAVAVAGEGLGAAGWVGGDHASVVGQVDGADAQARVGDRFDGGGGAGGQVDHFEVTGAGPFDEGGDIPLPLGVDLAEADGEVACSRFHGVDPLESIEVLVA